MRRYIGDQEVIRRYIGDTLVWEKAAPPEGFNWEALFNLSYDGAIDDSVPGANVIRPAYASGVVIPNPTPFGNLLDVNGNPLAGISIQMTGANTRADLNTSDATSPHVNLYRQRWWNNGNWFLDFAGLDDTKRYQAQFVSYEEGVAQGQVITTVTYRRGTNATNLFTLSGDASNPTPATYGFDDLNQIRHDELQSASGRIRLLVQRNGSVARSSTCYLVVREYNIDQDGVQTLRPAGSTDSPLPFVEYVPNGTGQKPAFIFLHGSGERGNGNAASLGNAMRYGPNWQAAMGTFDQDAYAFSPQIGTNTYWSYEQETLSGFIDWVIGEYEVDPSRVYLIGYSDGALGLGALVTHTQGTKVAAMVSIVYDPLYFQDPPANNSDVNEIAKVPCWVFRNRFDTFYDTQNVIDGVAAVNTVNAGIEKLTIFQDYSHQYPQKVVNGTGMGPMVDSNFDPFNQAIYSWLLEHAYSSGRTFDIGSGSGQLNISGTNPIFEGGLQDQDIINIIPGTYTTVNIQDINIPNGKVLIKPQTGRISVSGINLNRTIGVDIDNIDIVGGTQNNVNLSELPLKNITFNNLTLRGATNFCIRYTNLPTYDSGNIDGTVLQNLAFNNCEFVNCPQIRLGGDAIADTGRIIGLIFKNNVFRNRNDNYDFGDGESPDGSGIASQYIINVTNVEDYDFNGNYFYKMVRMSIHTSMIYALGWGSIRNNKAFKYRGQIARQWLYAREEGRLSVAYNNIGIDSLAYSILECQVTSNMSQSPTWKPSDYYCLFNTGVNLTSFDNPPNWQSIILDAYSTAGGNIYVDSNACINGSPSTGNPGKLYWGSVTEESNNLLFDDIEDAGVNEEGRPLIGSPLIGNGQQNPAYPIEEDIEGVARNIPPNVGVYENPAP